jgi:hypothetical protein
MAGSHDRNIEPPHDCPFARHYTCIGRIVGLLAFGTETATNHDAVGYGRALETPRREQGIGLAAEELVLRRRLHAIDEPHKLHLS